jgi:proteasome beta subunit
MNILLFLTLVLLCVPSGNATIVVAGISKTGIIIGTDSRSSPGGRIVSNRDAEKVYSLGPSCTLCHIGGAGSQFNQLCLDIEEILLAECYRFTGQPLSSSPLAIAKLTRRLIYTKYRSVHALVAGISTSSFILAEILPSGTLIEHDSFVVAGSGANVVLGLLERDFAGAPGSLALTDVKRRVETAVRIAIELDLRSGPPTKLYVLDVEGTNDNINTDSDNFNSTNPYSDMDVDMNKKKREK